MEGEKKRSLHIVFIVFHPILNKKAKAAKYSQPFSLFLLINSYTPIFGYKSKFYFPSTNTAGIL
ncbi:hypothetical protein J2795_002545 [Chryseobacterium bernardetii]|uniref:Uncharacterized protein n=2 Tax=Chryseobacterium TaxID=59732 RepID=A0A543EGT6_9FLAO|nr:hypothetical protein [Chryseobacterium vietnamense]MDR6441839.1 hypothetical protein [Chryseobacterium bernardetii]TQM20791.1 hypothetical protein FB551_0466 [Chryseobacterium aquifrigidense]